MDEGLELDIAAPDRRVLSPRRGQKLDLRASHRLDKGLGCNPPHILLIEDDTGLASVIRDALEGNGYQVTMADDGKEGFSLARKNSYDALLTDFQMPGQDGLETVRKLHEESPTFR